MPALRSLQHFELRAAGPSTIPLLNNTLRASPPLETISFSAGVRPSQLELVQHDGLRSLSFHNQYHFTSEQEARNPPELSMIAGAFPKLRELTITFGCVVYPCSFRFSCHWHTLWTLANRLHDLQHLSLSLHVPISSVSETPKGTGALQSLTYLELPVLYITPVDIDAFIKNLAMLCPNLLNIKVGILRELPGVVAKGMEFALGDSPAFVERFFTYKDAIRGSKVSYEDSHQEIH
ncbi:hypothetical protein FRB93_013068 [Tulasnella sp. JGI-2019a]|nr:hypothetical protein FRB93_013068 [Tulasnella sp. JGI-2019a]